MESLIEQLHTDTFSQITGQDSLPKDSMRKMEGFIKKLDSSMQETFILLLEQQMDSFHVESVGAFRQGFQLGVQLMIEVFEK